MLIRDCPRLSADNLLLLTKHHKYRYPLYQDDDHSIDFRFMSIVLYKSYVVEELLCPITAKLIKRWSVEGQQTQKTSKLEQSVPAV